MNTDLLYQLSISEVPHIGHVHAKILAETFETARDIFMAPQRTLEKIEGIGEVRARSIKKFRDFHAAEKEISFLEKYNIQSFYITQNGYPERLRNCYDPPVLLFYKGTADLNAPRSIAIVGTRNNTEYGKTVAEKLIRELQHPGLLIISGLAFGIDSIAHKAAIKCKIPTVGVTGHGLDTIYPAENTRLAKEMLKAGGLLTEFRSNTKPDKHNFPSRNRIVAGMTDATVVIESGTKGGSMITAEIAAGYHREVFAFPGRTTDAKSAGCNQLIEQNKAILLTDAKQLIEVMGWEPPSHQPASTQKNIFIELDDTEKKIVSLLAQNEYLRSEQLYLACGISPGAAASALLNLEVQQLVERVPGNRYRIRE